MSSWNKKKKWTDHQRPGTTYIEDAFTINQSIWYSTYLGSGENGMVEWDIKTEKIINIIKYPQYIPEFHFCCKYKNKIYIIDGDTNGEIILFDPSIKTFEKKADIPKIGSGANAVVVCDKMHIWNGQNQIGQNNASHHLIYDIIKNQVKRHQIRCTGMLGALAFLHQNNQIIQFGGRTSNGQSYHFHTDCLYSSPLSDNKNPKWIQKPKWCLKKGIIDAGIVRYKNWLMMFGGQYKTSYGSDTAACINDIYILNLQNDNEGWKVVDNICCPLPSQYRATIADNMVHLFRRCGGMYNLAGHYSLAISSILGDKYDINDDTNENKKEENEEGDIKCNNCDTMKDKLCVSETKANSLQTLVNDLLSNQYKLESEKQESMKEQNELKQQLEIKIQELSQQIVIMKQENKNKIYQFKQERERNQQKIQQLRQQNNVLNDECKEAKLELIEVKRELKELKKKNIDPSKFREWTSDEFVDWICSLEQGKYSKYEEKLRVVFIEEAISGEAIPHIEKNDWKAFGITVFMDRTNLHKHVQGLVNYNEGGNGTAYI